MYNDRGGAMKRNSHTTDQTGFDYMTNKGKEEQDRDLCGLLIASFLILALTIIQYAGMY